MNTFQMTARVMRAGAYQKRGLAAVAVAAVALAQLLLAVDPALMPDALVPYAPQIRDSAKWVLLVLAGAGAVAAQSKPPLVPGIAPEQPNLFADDERGDYPDREPL
jgi:hypothetical protein